MPSKLHHIGIEVSDILASERFYTELLDFVKVGEHSFADRDRHIVFLQLGDVCIELLSGGEHTPYQAPPATQCGWKHVALHTDNVIRDIEKLRAAGVTITMEPTDTALNSRIAFIADPDGTPVELWEDVPDASAK